MTRSERFAFLCSAIERQAIADLAARLQRSQSDAVRFVVIEAARQLAHADATHNASLPTVPSEEEGSHAAG